MTVMGSLRAAFLAVSVGALAGCEGGSDQFAFLKAKPKSDDGKAISSETPGKAGDVLEREVESPDVFEAKELALWDGRPSLGGVWVAAPGVDKPERVVIRNETNGKSVIGALFRRERDNPGPRLQLSSDAANELAILAGQPTELYVVALRKEQVEIQPALVETPPQATEAPIDAGPITETTLDGAEPSTTDTSAADLTPEASEIAQPAVQSEPATDPIAVATAALERTEALAPSADPSTGTVEQTTSLAAATTPAASPAPENPEPVRQKTSRLAKPFIQIGIFSVQDNADNAASSLRASGIVPTVKKQQSQGKDFWRVIVGPAANASERRALLKKIKELGYSDAYSVTN